MKEDLFKDGRPEAIQAVDVVAWTRRKWDKVTSCLFLPPIQRSVVWKNQQIVNYWDSLLRGYPAGLMLVHRPNQKEARDMEGQTTCEIRPDDFELFDGQQRLTAILLGHQAGQLYNRIKLWVDLGMEPHPDSGLLFQLRVSSTGQPFGYQPQWPNEKHALNKRRDKVDKWIEAKNLTRFDSLDAFAAVTGKDLIDANHSVPLQLHEAISLVNKGERHAIDELIRHWPLVKPAKIEDFVHALNGALKMQIIFQLIAPKVVEDGKEYIRFFGRLGQGGTPLTNDELTYSIIKYQYPHVHDCIKNVMDGTAGRVASEVNLVLAALRVAKVLSPWEGASEWEIVGRPFPGFVSRLNELPGVGVEFQKMISSTQGGRLKVLLEGIRDRLVYDKNLNPGGLPVMLMARLPHQLVDVLLLMATQQMQGGSEASKSDLLSPFVLHWLLFVKDHDKAARMIFKRHFESGRIVGQKAIQVLIQDFEKAEVSWLLPLIEQLPQIRADIENGDHRLRSGPERFAKLDADEARKCGDALRVLASDRELIKRLLLWLQRHYLARNYGDFNPTSSHDKDLPIDLDHMIPESKFGFNWNSEGLRPDFEDPDENFYWQRKPIGNSLGNFHWLDAAENRSRGAGKLVVAEGDLVQDTTPWDKLIEEPRWNANDVATFQKLIDLRTLDIYESLLVHGKLELIISHPNSSLNNTDSGS